MHSYASALTQRPSPPLIKGSAGNDTLSEPQAKTPCNACSKNIYKRRIVTMTRYKEMKCRVQNPVAFTAHKSLVLNGNSSRNSQS